MIGRSHIAHEVHHLEVGQFLSLHLLLDAVEVVFARLPDKLHLGMRLDQIQVLQHTAVHRSCAEASSYDQHGLLLRVESEGASCFLRCALGLQDVLSYGISRHDDAVGGEEALHPLVGHADLLGTAGQQLVGDARIGVLLLYEAGNAHSRARVERGTAGVATHAYCHHRAEVLDDVACHAQALEQVPHHADVFQQMPAVESLDGKSLDLVSRCRDTLHLHAALCADKENLCLGTHLPQRVGYRHGGEDMASRAATADDYPQFFVHCVRFKLPSAANLLQR